MRRRLTSRSCQLADAELLAFPDNSFDVVYSYEVMHHSPDTAQCLARGLARLKPGGQARIMLYHHPSLTGADAVVALWKPRRKIRGVGQCTIISKPGTKTYTQSEVRAMMAAFETSGLSQGFVLVICCWTRFRLLPAPSVSGERKSISRSGCGSWGVTGDSGLASGAS